jgi:predicted ribosome quality control (RQC) complex YloA/Tae2 family protein
MALDGFTIYALIDELRPKIANTRVDRIYQATPEEIVIQLRGTRDSMTLIISAQAQLARFQLGDRPYVPQNPPPFAMLLRKHLSGARLINLQQYGLERVIRFEFDTYEEYAGQAAKFLYLEIMGKHSNLIFADREDIILGAVKHVNELQSRVRQVLPGEKYTFPPSQHKKDPRTLSAEDLALIIGRSDPAKKVREILVKHLDGISPLLADELLFRSGFATAIAAGDLSESDTARLWALLAELADKTRTGLWESGAAFDESGFVIEFSCLTPTHLVNGQNTTVRELPLNQCVAESFEKTAANNRLAVLKQNLFRTVAQALARAQHRQKAHQEAIAAADKADQWRIYGDLLLSCSGAKGDAAEAGSHGKGQSVVTLINYYDPDCAEIAIPLDPAFTIAENAQKYFKKYTKIKRGLKFAAQQLEKAEQEISYLESVQTALEFANQPSEIDEILLELQQSGYQSARTRNRGKGSNKDQGKEKGRRSNAPEKAGFHKFKSSQGVEIIVGKNNVQNDRLTTEMAAPNDLWLHVQKAPGSHVLIRSGSLGGNQVDDVTLLEAANLAVYFSKMRSSSKVPVDYTSKKHVKKPPGFRPGMVIYDNFSTIIVDPNPATLRHFGLTD